jgi:hypothetical protein
MIVDPHPTRSAEFLSRLHDGDLTADERRRFEAHRETCAECRRGVEDYERTLAAYRAAEPPPAAADLSARILRKIRAQTPSRRPFDVRFGIDVRWAGVFAAALLVLLISAPLLLRRSKAASPAAAVGARDAIAARIVTLEAPPRSEPEAKETAPPAVAQQAPFAPAAPKSESSRPAAPPAGAGENAAAAPPSRLAAAPSAENKPARAFRRRAASPDRADETAGPGSGDVKDLERQPRVSVRALDGGATVPGVTSSPTDERLAPVRGRAFVVVVESGGRVRSVAPAAADGFIAREKTRRQGSARTNADAEVLRDLRFEPGDRPRRLLVRID